MEESSVYMLIREVAKDDLSAITEIDADISGAAKAEYWQNIFKNYQAHQDSHFFLVAEQGKDILGFVLGMIQAWEFDSPPCGWVFAIAVKPDKRLDGLGSKLLDSLCRYFRQAGVDKVRTMVAHHDHEALAFFRNQGMLTGPYWQLEKELE